MFDPVGTVSPVTLTMTQIRHLHVKTPTETLYTSSCSNGKELKYSLKNIVVCDEL